MAAVCFHSFLYEPHSIVSRYLVSQLCSNAFCLFHVNTFPEHSLLSTCLHNMLSHLTCACVCVQDLVTQCVSHDPKARPLFPQISEALMNIRDSVVAGQTSRPERALSAQPEDVQAPLQHSTSLQRENSVPVRRGGVRSLVMRPSQAPAPKPVGYSPSNHIPAWDPDAQSALELQKKKFPAVAQEQDLTIAGPDEVGGNIQEQGRRKAKVKNPCVPQFWKPSNMCSCTKTRTKSFMDDPAVADEQTAAAPAAPKDAKTSLRVKNFCFEQSRSVLLLCR